MTREEWDAKSEEYARLMWPQLLLNEVSAPLQRLMVHLHGERPESEFEWKDSGIRIRTGDHMIFLEPGINDASIMMRAPLARDMAHALLAAADRSVAS